MLTPTSALALLESRRLLLVTRERERLIVRFKHVLTREATYNSILHVRRAQLHRAAAETLSELHPQPDLQMVLTIADHWLRAGEQAAALETILPHAISLVHTGRSVSLTAVLTRLDRATLDEPQQRALDIALADAHAARGEYEPARELYARALSGGGGDRAVYLLERLGSAEYQLGHYARAIEHQQASLALAAEQGDGVAKARALDGLGLTYAQLGERAKALQYLEESRALSVQLGESFELANTEFNLAGILLDKGDFADAIEVAKHALELDEQLGHPALAARTLQLLGACYFGLQDLARAEQYYTRALEASLKTGDTIGTAIAQVNLGELFLEQQDSSRAISSYGDAVRQLRILRHDNMLSAALAGLAQAETLAAQAQPESERTKTLIRAAEYAQQALELADRIQLAERQGVARRVLAQIYMQQNERADAQREAEHAVALLEQGGSALELKHALDVLERLRKSN